jgi:hypothetical protein
VSEETLKVTIWGEHTRLCGRVCHDPDEQNTDDLEVFEGTKEELLEIAEAYDKMPSAFGTRVARAIRRECE